MTDRYLAPFKDWEVTLMQQSFDALGHLLYGLEDSLDTDSPEDYDGPMTGTAPANYTWDMAIKDICLLTPITLNDVGPTKRLEDSWIDPYLFTTWVTDLHFGVNVAIPWHNIVKFAIVVFTAGQDSARPMA